MATPSIRRSARAVAAVWLASFWLAGGGLAGVWLTTPSTASADPAPSRDTAVAPEPAPPTQRNAPPAKIAPPLNAGSATTSTPPTATDGLDVNQLQPGHGDTIKPKPDSSAAPDRPNNK